MWEVFCWGSIGAFLGCMAGLYIGSWRRGKQEAAKLVKRAADLRGESDRLLDPNAIGDLNDRYFRSKLLLASALEVERQALAISGEKGAGR